MEDYVERWSKYVSTRAGASRGTAATAAVVVQQVIAPCSLCVLLQDATELKDKLTGSSRAAIVTSADGLLHQVGVWNAAPGASLNSVGPPASRACCAAVVIPQVNAALQHLQQALPEDDAELSEEQEASLVRRRRH